MRLSGIVLLLLVPGFAWSGELLNLLEVDCKSDAGSVFYLNVNENLVSASMDGIEPVSSQYNEEPESLSIIDWVPGKLYGFGGIATSSDQRYTGLLSFLYKEGQELQLPEEGDLRIYYADLHGIVADEIMNCRLQFSK